MNLVSAGLRCINTYVTEIENRNGEQMSNHTEETTQREVVTVRVEAEHVTKLPKGSRWVVIESSLDSLWQGAYTVKLEAIDSKGGNS